MTAALARFPASTAADTAALFASDADLRATLASLLAQRWPDLPVTEGGLSAALTATREGPPPAVLFVDVGDAVDAAAGIRALARQCGDGTRLVALGRVNDVALYRALIGAGAADYLVPPFSDEALAQAIDQRAMPPVAPVENAGGRLIAVLGARGGVGATFLSVNMAWLLATEYGLRTGLLDLDLRFGTTALALDLEPGRGLHEALRDPDRIDSLFAASALVPASETLFVLGSEGPLDGQPAPSPDAFKRLLGELRPDFEMLVADLPRDLAIGTDLLAEAETVVLVSDLSLAGMRDSMRIVDRIRRTAPAARLALVAAQTVGGKGEITAAEFERGLDMKIAHHLPLDRKTAAAAANAGRPAAATAPKSALGRALRTATRDLATVEAPPRKGLAGLLKRRRT